MKVTLTINTVDSIAQTLDSALYMLRHAWTPWEEQWSRVQYRLKYKCPLLTSIAATVDTVRTCYQWSMLLRDTQSHTHTHTLTYTLIHTHSHLTHTNTLTYIYMYTHTHTHTRVNHNPLRGWLLSLSIKFLHEWWQRITDRVWCRSSKYDSHIYPNVLKVRRRHRSVVPDRYSTPLFPVYCAPQKKFSGELHYNTVHCSQQFLLSVLHASKGNILQTMQNIETLCYTSG